MSSSSPSTWEDISTVVPRSATSDISSEPISSRASGSRSAIGSSRRSSSGRFPKANAKATRVRWPPERPPTLASSGIWPASRTIPSAAAWSHPGLSSWPSRRISVTVNRLNSGLSWPR